MAGAMISTAVSSIPGCARPRQQWQSQCAAPARCFAAQMRAAPRCRSLIARAQDSDDEEKRRAVEEAMKDPSVRARIEAMEEQMANPEMAAQMAQMQAVMANPEIMARMAELREDPELKPMFAEIQKGGMAALQKVMSDPIFLTKIGEKLGDVDMTAPPPTAAAMGPPEINTLLDAARYGDTEAVEDFLAIGKDVNMQDEQNRTALHYAVAYQQLGVAEALLEAGADLELADVKANTPLHYAAGYGRGELVKRLLQAGANGSALNDSQHTPYALVSEEPRNPLNQDAEIQQLLQAAASVAAA